MRDETCPTRLNRPFSREKPKPQMEYMSTSNCSLHKNDLISVTLATFSLLFVARSHLEWWRLEILCSEQFEVGICSISGHFWLWFLTIVLDTREGRIWFWSSAAWPLTFLFLSFSTFYYWAALWAKPNQKRVAASSLQEKDKTADGSGFPSPLSPHCC